jgi:flagellar biosynthesis GTPase FlhF
MTARALADFERSIAEAVEQSKARSDELIKKLTAGQKKPSKEEQDLSKKLVDLRKQAAAGNKEAAKEEQELSKQLAEMRKQRAADDMKAMQQAIAEMADASKIETAWSGPTLSLRFWGWIQAKGSMFTLCIQIMILSFFIQAIANALGEKDQATSIPRVAWLALLTLTLLLLSSVVSPTAWLVYRLGFWIIYPLGLVSIVWQAIMLIEACNTIGKHLNPKST